MTVNAGDLDLSFDLDGKITTLIGNSAIANDMLIQSLDGKIVTVGGTVNGEFALARYNADGSLDSTFGSNGIVTTGFLGTFGMINNIIQQADGSFVVVGISTDNMDRGVGNYNYVLARYSANGILDTTFGTNGTTITDLGSIYDEPKDLIQLNNGQFLVVGHKNDGQGATDFALTRYTSTGILDASFGVGGTLTTNFFATANGSADQANSVIQLHNGDILVAGSAFQNGSNSTYGDFALARYDVNGNLVTSFGNGGKVTTDLNANSSDTAQTVIEIQETPGVYKLVVAGSIGGGIASTSYQTDFAITRYNSDGSLDMSFGTGGKVITDVGSFDAIESILYQADGKLVAAGSNGADLVVVRYNSNGSLDTSFGNGGKVITDFGGGEEFSVASIVQQADGNLVIAGNTIDATTGEYKIALARYIGSNGVVVPINNVPIVSNAIAAQGATANSLFTFTVPTNTFTDLDAGDTLSLSATLANGSALPSWLTFNASTNTFSGTPTNANADLNLSIRVTATDSLGATVSQNFDLGIGKHLVGTNSSNTINGTIFNDKIEGLNGADTLNGGDGNDIIDGGASNDVLNGGNGRDILLGGSGQDILTGGAGNDILMGGMDNTLDRFTFSGGALGGNTVTNILGLDMITDFVVGQDRIILSKATFGAITSAVGGSIGSNFANVANDSLVGSQSAAIVFSQSSNKLFYNQNSAVAGLGTNGGEFAELTGIASLTNNSFSIIG